MTGARINVVLDDKDYLAALTRFGGVLHTGVPKAIGVALVKQTQKRFDTGVDVEGTAWQALSPGYAAIKQGPGILRASRMLQRSITSKVEGLRIAVGSNRIYAAVHQFGATIKPVRAPALAFQVGVEGPEGDIHKAFVHVKSVRIPQRPYLGFGPNDRRAVMEVLTVTARSVFE